MKSASFKDLIVWQKSLLLAKEIYGTTHKMPSTEIYGLISQMRRSAVSIPSNIAEGSKRGTKKDFIYFLRIARGSTAELETQILLSKDIFPRINFEDSEILTQEIEKMLGSLIAKIST